MADISKISNGGTTYYFRDRNYGTCTTSGSTAAKVATLDGFTLATGSIVHIKFTNTNTASAPTLNVNSTGAYPIVRYGTTAPGTTPETSWHDSGVLTLVFDGTYWTVTDDAGGDMSIIAPDYSELTFPVEKGAHCIHNGDYYIAKQNISTSEAWDSSHWEETTVGDENSALRSALQVKLDEPSVAGTQGQVLTSDGDGGQTWETPVVPTVPVTDVQINSTSILNQGVADIPVAGTNVLGVSKYDGTSFGIDIVSSGVVYVNKANDAQIKASSGSYRPITPDIQDKSCFYALAKASGDSTQSASANAVGVYTETAKSKIRDMLEPQFRLIKEITISEDVAGVYVDSDSNGSPIALHDVIIHISGLLCAGNGIGGIVVNNGASTLDWLTKPNVAMTALCSNSTAQTKIINLSINGGRFFGFFDGSNVANGTTSYNIGRSLNSTGIIECSSINNIYLFSVNGYKLTAGTIKIYGR